MKYLIGLTALFSGLVVAEETNEIQDMSDPLAVYTQLGMGVSDTGLALKVGQTYDTGKENTAGMNIIELRGAMGESLGLNDADDSIDHIRFRNFTANLKNGRGAQINVEYDVDSEKGNASYSFIQALPKLGPVTFYPLLGAGLSFQNTTTQDGQSVGGYSMPGTFALIGTYGKLQITDKLWLNYNPMWFAALSGSDKYTETGFEGNSNVLQHEAAVSYQVTPRFNVRYFANWSTNQDFKDGAHRIEMNYQL